MSDLIKAIKIYYGKSHDCGLEIKVFKHPICGVFAETREFHGLCSATPCSNRDDHCGCGHYRNGDPIEVIEDE